MRVFLALGAAILTCAVTAIALTPSMIPVADLPPAAPFTLGTIAESPPFGDEFGGKPLWLSANGRYVAMFRLTDDTDGNGRLNIEFGMHGDSWGDDLMLDVFDLVHVASRLDDRRPRRRLLRVQRGNRPAARDARHQYGQWSRVFHRGQRENRYGRVWWPREGTLGPGLRRPGLVKRSATCRS
jgi:hypothetical protein